MGHRGAGRNQHRVISPGPRSIGRTMVAGRKLRLSTQPSALGTQHSVDGPNAECRMLSAGMYIELHARSAFSFLEGASLPESLIAACANLNMPAMALLDRDGVYGSPRFHMAA